MGVPSFPTKSTGSEVLIKDDKKVNKKCLLQHYVTVVLATLCAVLIIFLLLLTHKMDWKDTQSKITLNQSEERAGSTLKGKGSLLQDSCKFFLASDLHFDYYYDSMVAGNPTFCRKIGNYGIADYYAPYGRVGCDTPRGLIDNAMNAMKNVYDKDGAEFVLITGDVSAHNTDAEYFVNGTMRHRVLRNTAVVMMKLLKTFRHIPVFPLLGNNDIPGHYVLPASDDDPWYKQVLALYAPLILCKGCPKGTPKPTTFKKLKKTFLDGGYYQVNIANGRMVLIILNSLYWNVKCNTGSTYMENKAMKQMTWLRQQLLDAKKSGKKAIIASHIPPGIDPFGSAPPFWLSNYTNMYVDIVARDYYDVVAAQFFAHIHKDDFKLQVLDTQKAKNQKYGEPPIHKSFAILPPSLSPIYDNNPAFRHMYLDTDKQALLDYDQYYLDLVLATEFKNPKWVFDYRFSKKYPSTRTHIDADRIYELIENLINQNTENTWKNYAFSRAVNYQPGTYSRFMLYCAIRHVFTEDFQECMKKYVVPGG